MSDRSRSIEAGAQAGMLAASLLFLLQIVLNIFRLAGAPAGIAALTALYPDLSAQAALGVGIGAWMLGGAAAGALYARLPPQRTPWGELALALACYTLQVLLVASLVPRPESAAPVRSAVLYLLLGLLWSALVAGTVSRAAAAARTSGEPGGAVTRS